MLTKNTFSPAMLMAAVVSLAFAGCEKPATGTAKSDKSAQNAVAGEGGKTPGQTGETPAAKPSEKTPPAGGESGTQLAAAPKVDPTKIPDGDVAALLEHLNILRQQQPTPGTAESEALEQKQLQEGIIATADKILADPMLQPGDRLRVINAKWQALGTLMNDNDDAAKTKFMKFTDSLLNDADESTAGRAMKTMLELNYAFAHRGESVDFGGVAETIARRVEGQPSQSNVMLAQEAAQILEICGANDGAGKIFAALDKAAASSTNPMLAEFAKSIAEAGKKKLALIGTKPNVEGRLITGEKFDWEKYRGKVVLLDFWATWCGPCLRELPNVKKAYEEFNPKGFEVVGISLDDDEGKLKEFLDKEKLPWATLFGENPEARGFELPLATEFAVNGIPATYLIDKEGKIISISARGPMLEKQLAKMLGEKEGAKP